MKTLGLVLICTFASVALAAPPPAPAVNVAATDIRQLEFNWDPVPGAQRYELWFRSAPGAQWVKFREQPAQRAPLFRIGVSVHLLDWKQARYYVAACNTGGCTPSNQVDVDGEQLQAMGFIKPKAPTGHETFGSAVAASADGKTFAVLTSEQIGTAAGSAAVHVYRKTTSSSGWRREARLLPSIIQTGTAQPYVGDPLAISGDGNLLVLGVAFEDRNTSNGRQELGAVYLFRRTGTTWQQTQRIVVQDGQFSDRFGYAVKLDEAGRTLVISREWPASGFGSGTLEVYRDAPNDGSSQFVRTATVPAPPPLPPNNDSFNCESIALSGDGNTLLRACNPSNSDSGFAQVLKAPGWTESTRLGLPISGVAGVAIDYAGRTALLEAGFYTDVWRLGDSGWAYEDRLHMVSGAQSFQRPGLAISRDGKIVALGNSGEYTIGLGPVFGNTDFGDENNGSGGVIVWERKPSGWMLRRLVKPGSTHSSLTGHAVALGDNGKLLIVGAPWDPSAAVGFDGDRDDDSAPMRGAVWVY
jgi:hypothetical protein